VLVRTEVAVLGPTGTVVVDDVVGVPPKFEHASLNVDTQALPQHKVSFGQRVGAVMGPIKQKPVSKANKRCYNCSRTLVGANNERIQTRASNRIIGTADANVATMAACIY
jgi:hypothetical protein